MKIVTLTGQELESNNVLSQNRKTSQAYNMDYGIRSVIGVPGSFYPFPYFFGVEIENSDGDQVDPEKIREHALCFRIKEDCSVSGMEYETGILAGDEGAYELRRLSQLMATHSFNYKCGTHMHFSGFKVNSNYDHPFLFMLTHKISNDLAKFQSEERIRLNPHVAIIQEEDLRSRYEGCSMRYGDLKWQFRSEACMWNFETDAVRCRMRTSTEDKLQYPISGTVEFRILDGTNNWDKLYAYLLTYSSLLEFFERNRDHYFFDKSLFSFFQIQEAIPSVFEIIQSSRLLSSKMKSFTLENIV